MSSSFEHMRAFFAHPPGSEGAMSALQHFPEPQRRILVAVRGLKDYANLPIPGDVGFGILGRLDGVWPTLLAQARTDRAWLVRAAAGLFGLVAEARASGVWETPLGAPIFMAISPQRPEPVLISPLRLALDAVSMPRSCFHATWRDVLTFREGRGPLPEHIFRVDLVNVGESARPSWQWAWSLVAVCGRFHDGEWDLNFHLDSLGRLGALLLRGEDGASGHVALALRAVDVDRRRRESWLITATACYLGEVLRRSFGGNWTSPRSEGADTTTALLTFPAAAGRTLDPIPWVRAALLHRDEQLFVRLGAWLHRAVLHQLPWPEPPP